MDRGGEGGGWRGGVSVERVSEDHLLACYYFPTLVACVGGLLTVR